MRRKQKLSDREKVDWCYEFKASSRWLSSVLADKSGSAHTELFYAKALYEFCQWCGLNPDQLIEQRRRELEGENVEVRSEDRLRQFCLWLEGRGLKRSTVVCKFHSPIRSFYKYNGVPLRVPLPRYVQEPIQPHSLDEIKALMRVADVRERAILMFLKDSGMSREDIVGLKYGDIRREFEVGKEFIHIRAVRRKEALAYDTFIGRNAVEALRAWLDYRRNFLGEKITDDSFLFTGKSGKPLTPAGLDSLFYRLSRKAGFKTSPHRFRKFFESHMGLSAPSILVKYWMGHSLGVEKSYFLPPIEKQREEYIKAYAQIDISERELSEVERRKQQILDMVRLLIPEKFETVKNVLMKVKSARELDSKIENIMAVIRREREGFEAPMIKIKRKKEVEEDSEDCQKIVCEDELEVYLRHGWKVQAVLPSGKIVIER